MIFNTPGLLHRSYPHGEAAGRVMHRTKLAIGDRPETYVAMLVDAIVWAAAKGDCVPGKDASKK